MQTILKACANTSLAGAVEGVCALAQVLVPLQEHGQLLKKRQVADMKNANFLLKKRKNDVFAVQKIGFRATRLLLFVPGRARVSGYPKEPRNCNCGSRKSRVDRLARILHASKTYCRFWELKTYSRFFVIARKR